MKFYLTLFCLCFSYFVSAQRETRRNVCMLLDEADAKGALTGLYHSISVKAAEGLKEGEIPAYPTAEQKEAITRESVSSMMSFSDTFSRPRQDEIGSAVKTDSVVHSEFDPNSVYRIEVQQDAVGYWFSERNQVWISRAVLEKELDPREDFLLDYAFRKWNGVIDDNTIEQRKDEVINTIGASLFTRALEGRIPLYVNDSFERKTDAPSVLKQVSDTQILIYQDGRNPGRYRDSQVVNLYNPEEVRAIYYCFEFKGERDMQYKYRLAGVAPSYTKESEAAARENMPVFWLRESDMERNWTEEERTMLGILVPYALNRRIAVEMQEDYHPIGY